MRRGFQAVDRGTMRPTDIRLLCLCLATTVKRMTISLAPPHADLTFMSPLSEQRAEDLVRFLARDLSGTVVDIGCGWAELLLRTVAAAPGTRGIGLDIDAASIEHGRWLAEQRGLGKRVRLEVGDARLTAPPNADGVICIGATQVWAPPSRDHTAGGLRTGIDRAARHGQPG